MLIKIDVDEVEELAGVLFQASVDAQQRSYDLLGEPIYSYDEKERNAKKEEIREYERTSDMYYSHYAYWTDVPYRVIYHMADVSIDELKSLVKALRKIHNDINEKYHALESTPNSNDKKKMLYYTSFDQKALNV